MTRRHSSLESLQDCSPCKPCRGDGGGVLCELLVREGRHEAVGDSRVLGPSGVDVDPQVAHRVLVVEFDDQSGAVRQSHLEREIT